MTPLAQLPPGLWRHIHGVFTDIDDTLTTDGALTADARAALTALRAAGLPVIAITGRPVGWSQPFALEWPLSAIVAENGAVALIPQPDGSLRKLYVEPDSALRQANYQRLQAVAAQVLREVPGARLAQDSPGRETDIAIDHSEHHCLPAEAIEQAAALMRREGLNATSIDKPEGITIAPFNDVPSDAFQSTAPLYIALLGHSGSQAPQFMQSSVILIAIMLIFLFYYFCAKLVKFR